jgi:PIN like domain
MTVVAHDDIFPEGTEDRVWLARAGAEGWVVLTKDQAIRYSPAEREALRRGGVREFVMAHGNLTSAQMAESFVTARPAMEAILRRTVGPFVARVSKTGAISTVQRL